MAETPYGGFDQSRDQYVRPQREQEKLGQSTARLLSPTTSSQLSRYDGQTRGPDQYEVYKAHGRKEREVKNERLKNLNNYEEIQNK